MKRIISVFLILAILCSSGIMVEADEINDKSENYALSESLLQYLKTDNHGLLCRNNNYGYMNFVNGVRTNEVTMYFFEMANIFAETGVEPDKEKYMEVLVNIMATYEMDNAPAIAEQQKQDNLKSAKDYAVDIAGIVSNSVSLSVEGELEEWISTAISGVDALIENIDNWIDAFSNLETIVQDYRQYDDFLKVIEQNAEGELRSAASALRTSMKRAIEIKLDTYKEISNENFQNYEELLFEDVFFAVLEQTNDYSTNSNFRFLVDCGDEVVSVFSELKSSWELGTGIGKLIGNVVVGGEDLANRTMEMRALYDISMILQKELMEVGGEFAENYLSAESDELAKEYVAYSNFLIGCRIRGEYCLYSVIASDAGLLSWANKKNAQEAAEWYKRQSGNILEIRDAVQGVEDFNDINENLREEKQLEDNHVKSIMILNDEVLIGREFYDFEGRIIRKENYSIDSTLSSWEKYIYDENSLTIYTYSGMYEIREKETQIYDEESNTRTISYFVCTRDNWLFDLDSYIVQYYEDSMKVREEYFDAGHTLLSWKAYSYDAKGRVVCIEAYKGTDALESCEEYLYNPDGSYDKKVRGLTNEDKYFTRTESYDKYDYCLKMEAIVEENRKGVENDITYQYDDDGNLIEVNQVMGGSGKTYVYKFEYDDNNNLIRTCEIQNSIYEKRYLYYETDGAFVEDYDVMLYKMKDYAIVAKNISDFNSIGVEIGVLSGDLSEWIYPLSTNHIFLKKDSYGNSVVKVDGTNGLSYSRIRYVGNGMFVATTSVYSRDEKADMFFYNIEENSGFGITETSPITYELLGSTYLGHNNKMQYENGKAILVNSDDKICAIDKLGNMEELEICYDGIIGKYSMGLFFYNDGFYDIEGNRIIDLCVYKKQIEEYYNESKTYYSEPYFSSADSVARVYMIGADNDIYYIEVKRDGTCLNASPVRLK